MRIQRRVESGGRVIHQATIDMDSGITWAEVIRLAADDLNRSNLSEAIFYPDARIVIEVDKSSD